MKKMENVITMRNARQILKNRLAKLPKTITGKFDRENAVWQEIKSRHEFTQEDRLAMLAIMQTPYHDSGKIEGIQSYDSSASHSTFCQKMQEAGEKDNNIICHYCYDKKQEDRWTNVKKRHGLQLELISSYVFSVEELSILRIYTPYFRFNSSGEIENVIQLINYYRIAKAFPKINFRPWSKNKAVVALGNKMESKPSNLKTVYSVPRIDGDVSGAIPEGFDFQFVVARTPEKVTEYIMNGACECNGKHCIDCEYRCYRDDEKGWKSGSVIVEILRD